MNQTDLEQIVKLVTQQVMQAMDPASAHCANTDGLTKVLVVGGTDAPIPEELSRDSVLLELEDYTTNQNILRYDRVIITHLSITQLADIALGRIGDEVTCAVIHALLNGIDTFLLPEALAFRKFAGKGSNALYNLLEQYAQTLQVFGVKAYKEKPRLVQPEAKPAKFAPPPAITPRGSMVPNSHRLITETEALALVNAGGSAQIPTDAILTPLARDILTKAGMMPNEK